MEEPLPGDRAGRVFNLFIVTLILANVAAVILESDRDIEAAYRHLFAPFETFSVAVFTIEYLVRIWIADEHPKARRHGSARARGRYMISLLGIVDLLAILPFYIGLLVTFETQQWRILRFFRAFKLAHHSAALEIVGRVLYSQRLPAPAARPSADRRRRNKSHDRTARPARTQPRVGMNGVARNLSSRCPFRPVFSPLS